MKRRIDLYIKLSFISLVLKMEYFKSELFFFRCFRLKFYNICVIREIPKCDIISINNVMNLSQLILLRIVKKKLLFSIHNFLRKKLQFKIGMKICCFSSKFLTFLLHNGQLGSFKNSDNLNLIFDILINNLKKHQIFIRI